MHAVPIDFSNAAGSLRDVRMKPKGNDDANGWSLKSSPANLSAVPWSVGLAGIAGTVGRGPLLPAA